MMINKIKGKIKNKLKNWALKGDNVHCVCCKKDFVTFLPGGVVRKRENVLCPNCGSLERHRLIWHYISYQTDLLKSQNKLLHIAPEKLFFRIFSTQPNVEYVPGAKFGEGYEDEYPAGTLNIDLTAIDLPDNSFDVVLCSHVLEHIPDDAQAMKELYRVLKPGGWGIVQVPLDPNREKTYEDFSITSPEEREKAFGQYDHVRVYGNDYGDRLSKAGFEVHRMAYAKESFTQTEFFRLGFIDDDIFLVRKN